MAHNLLRPREVASKRKSSLSTVYKEIREGLWTPFVSMGPRLRALPETEVDLQISWRVAGKSNDEIRLLVPLLVAARKSAGEEKRPTVSSPGRQPAPDLVERPA